MRGVSAAAQLVPPDETGAVLFGDTADGLWYLDLIRSGANIETIRDDLAFGRALAERTAPARMAA
jgi:nitrite reductase (NADH) large subunit